MNILQTRFWSESEFGMKIHRGSALLDTIFNNYALELMDKAMPELYEQYMSLESTQWLFAAPMGKIADTYMSIDDSVDALERLLLFQHDNDAEVVHIFLCDLVDILERRKAKYNTFFVLGASNSGKNFFFDAVVHFFFEFRPHWQL